MELDTGVFNLPNVTTIIPTATAITNALTIDPALDTMLGPYVANAPDTKGVKMRKVCPVPYSLAGLWLLDKEGVTWQ